MTTASESNNTFNGATSQSASRTMRALRQYELYAPLEVTKDHPIPMTESGTAVVKVLYAGIVSYTNEVYLGKRKYPYPVPLTTGTAAICRVHKLPVDSTGLKEGQLVLVDIVVRSRDTPSDVYLRSVHEGFSEGSRKLMRATVWRDGTYAEYAAAPLETIYALNEKRLCSLPKNGGLGLAISELTVISRLLVPWGGLTDIGLTAGETIVIAPATGGFGGAAVHVALAMGARVIAMGRNEAALGNLVKTFAKVLPSDGDRLKIARITGDVDKDLASIKAAAGNTSIDVFFDISPPSAWQSSHFKAAIMSLRHSGRVSLMGGQMMDVPVPISKIMHWNLQLRGKWMYERSDVEKLLKLIECGNLKIGQEEEGYGGFRKAKEFALEDWQAAFNSAEKGLEGDGAIFAI